jgi:hypothetical protein
LNCQHGPIDLLISADGARAEVLRAYRAAAELFPTILPSLCAELDTLRRPAGRRDVDGAATDTALPVHPISRRMHAAVWPYRDVFITPMAAVAGAVAEAVLAAMTGVARLDRAWVNNGGDIALHLSPGHRITAGVVADLAAPAIDATVTIRHDDPVRGIATSGWRGRSQSLGIADAVTVLAATAAEADAAATIIANAVDAADPAVRRRPAREVRHDSDLGDLPVTVAVGPLAPDARARALEAGAKKAAQLVLNRRIAAAFLSLQGEVRVAGAIGRTRSAA